MAKGFIRLSEKIGTQFCYDWSNPDMPEDTFIYQVLERGMFKDMLSTTIYFGLDRVDFIFDQYKDGLFEATLRNYRNIRRGYLKGQERAEAIRAAIQIKADGG